MFAYVCYRFAIHCLLFFCFCFCLYYVFCLFASLFDATTVVGE